MWQEDRKDCKHWGKCEFFADCLYCPAGCAHYKHEDEVMVMRCADCIYYRKRGGIYHDDSCAILYYGDGTHRTVCERDFCSYGKKAVKV